MDLDTRISTAEQNLNTQKAALQQLELADPQDAAAVARQKIEVNDATSVLQGLQYLKNQQQPTYNQNGDPTTTSPTVGGTPGQPTLPAMHGGEQWNLSSFMRSVPNYNHHEVSWDVYMDQFKALWNLYPLVRDVYAKNVLYTSLKGEAMKMASPQFNPAKYPTETLDQYSALLRELFEPASESEQSKLAFEARHQLQGEHPSYYYQDKVSLFKRAYRDGQRDFTYFYNKVISGLINQEMRNYLRLKLPSPLSDTNQFRNDIMFIATVVRRKFLDGEISESEAIGAEAFTSLNSYTTNTKEATLGKQVNMVAAAYATNKSAEKPALCYHCRSKEHFIAQCPRKAAGLPATVHAMTAPQPQVYNRPSNQPFRKVRYNPPFRGNAKKVTNQPAKPRYQQFGQNKGYYQQRGRAGQIMFVYENDDGEFECTDIDREENAEEDAPEDVTQEEEINQVQPAGDGGESDYVAQYVPGAFLGLTQ